MATQEHTAHYFYGIWFIGDGRSDWMAKLFKIDGKWRLEYRFRYYDPADPGNDPYSGKDRKSWYAVESEDDSDEHAERMAAAIDTSLKPVMEMRYGDTMTFVDMHCRDDEPRFFEQMSKQPWAHAKKVTPEEFERLKAEGRV